ncbi:MAG: single-stranded DNA-binding protein [Candidatus Omnitrophota bacterium]
MANLNKVFLIGNLTKDPELRYTPQGTAVVNLRLAVNRRYKNKDQQAKEETCFITVVAWNKQAEVCNQYLQKGRSVFIEGRLQSRSWEDAAGSKRSVIEVRAERVQFMGQPVIKTTPEAPAEEVAQEASTETAWLEDLPDGRQESEGEVNEG